MFEQSHMRKLFRRLVPFAFFVLVAFAPTLTRYIWRTGLIDGHPVEPGTVSLFAMQLVALAYATLVFATRRRDEWRGFWRRPETAAVISLVCMAGISMLVSDDPAASIVAWLSLTLAAAVALAVFLHRPDPHETLITIAGAAVFQAGFGIVQFFMQEVVASKWLGTAAHTAADVGAFVIETGSGRWLRSYGLLPHPNVYGVFIALGLLATVGLAGHRAATLAKSEPPPVPAGMGVWPRFSLWAKTSPLRFYALLPILTAALLFSFSRTAFVAAAAGAVWLGISAFGTPAAPAVRRVAIPCVIITAVTLGILGLIYREPLIIRAQAVGRLENRSIVDRFIQVSDAGRLILEYPLFGVGPGRMPFRVQQELDTGRDWWRYDYVHDVPLLVAAESGIFGLLAWLAAVGLGLSGAVKRLLRRRRTPTLTGTTAFAAGFIALLVAGLFDHFLWSSWFGQLIFWLVFGMLQVAAEKTA